SRAAYVSVLFGLLFLLFSVLLRPPSSTLFPYTTLFRSSKRFVTLVVEGPGECDAPYMSTLWHDGKIVGETLSGGWGHRIDKSIVLAMIRADLAEPGSTVEVEIFGERFKAVVQKDEPLWDPKNERLRA